MSPVLIFGILDLAQGQYIDFWLVVVLSGKNGTVWASGKSQIRKSGRPSREASMNVR